MIGDYINWKANGKPVDLAFGFDDSVLPQITNNLTNQRKGMLKVRGSNYTNNTNVSCLAMQLQKELISGVYRLTTDESGPALILVQGIYRYIEQSTLM